jgi:hypothetical protein
VVAHGLPGVLVVAHRVDADAVLAVLGEQQDTCPVFARRAVEDGDVMAPRRQDVGEGVPSPLVSVTGNFAVMVWPDLACSRKSWV